MEIQWDKNPEYTFYMWVDFGTWSLPISLQWRIAIDAVNNKYRSLAIRILCFGFEIDYWKWNDE